jgi:CBS domain containing-hemolysin-like protein
MIDIFWVTIALLLVVVNGFFVAAEFSLVKLRPTRIRTIAKTKGWPGQILAKVHAKLDVYLSACQLGITLASLGLGWIGEPAFANLLEPVFERFQVNTPELIHGISFAFAFTIISFLHIVAGELAPKSMALRNPEIIGIWSAPPLYGFYWLMYPAIWTLNSSANLVLRVLGLGQGNSHETHYSADELKLILRGNRTSGRFTQDEWNIMAQTLDFSELEVSDLMRPIHEIVALYRNKSLRDNLQTVYESRFSRYPYFDTNGIDVLGVIHLKDLFLAQQENKAIDNFDSFLRPIRYISANTSALDLLRHFRTGMSHFTMIGQRGKKPQGFITLDNLLSAMVGEIHDEFRHNSNDWIRLYDGTLLCKGSLPIFSLERILGIDIENEELELEDEVSIGGLIMSKLQDIPIESQKIEFDQFEILVKKMDGPRIDLVQVYPSEIIDQ